MKENEKIKKRMKCPLCNKVHEIEIINVAVTDVEKIKMSK